jgi:hypothetical protein
MGRGDYEESDGPVPRSLRDLDYENVTGADVKPVVLGRTTRYRSAKVVLHVGEDEDSAEPRGYELDYEQVQRLAGVFDRLASDLEPDDE